MPRTRCRRLRLERLEDRTLLTSGQLDPGFGTGGTVRTDFLGPEAGSALAVVVQPDAKVVVAAAVGLRADLALLRYNADGSMDGTFGQAGETLTHLDAPVAPHALALLPGGKFVVAAALGGVYPDTRDFLVLRYNADGTLDTSFGTGGMTRSDFGGADDVPSSLAVLDDGRLVVAGSTQVLNPPGNPKTALARYTADGQPDSTFGQNGELTSTVLKYGANDLAAQPDGKLIIAGAATDPNSSQQLFALARFNADGSLDTGFGTGGKALVAFIVQDSSLATAVAIQPADGKLVAAGTDEFGKNVVAARFNAEGSLDTSFGAEGKIVTHVGGQAVSAEAVRRVLLQTDKKIVLAGGEIGHDGFLLRYTAAGSPDLTFGQTGTVTYSFGGDWTDVNDAALAPDGTLVAAGDAHTSKNGGAPTVLTAARFTTLGVPDVTFGTTGQVTTPFTGPVDTTAGPAVLQPDGKLVVVGRLSLTDGGDFLAVRYNADGSLDASFGQGGKATADFGGNEGATTVVLQGDGKLVLGGAIPDNQMGLVRFNADGSLDTSFGQGGKVVVNPNNTYGLTTVAGMALLPGGKILTIGTQTTGSFSFRHYSFLIYQFKPNGSIDRATSTTAVNVEAYGEAIAVQADGKIVAAGWGMGPGAKSQDFAVARFLPDLNLDHTFGNGGFTFIDFGNFDKASSLALEPGGKIIVAGTSVPQGGPSSPIYALARLSANGVLDGTFGSGGKVATPFSDYSSGSVADVLLQANGKVVVVGTLAGSKLANPAAPAQGFTTVRYTYNGRLDPDFGVTGRVITPFGSVYDTATGGAIRPDGKIVVAGTTANAHNFQIGLAQYLTSPSPNERYVAKLYPDLLGRPADPAGLITWSRALDAGVSKFAVALALMNTDEYRLFVVRDLYQKYLHRAADTQGAAAYVAFLRQGGTVEQAKAFLLGSTEYFQNRAGGTNGGFLSALYRDVLNRDPDSSATQSFGPALAGGASRTPIALLVASSDESDRIVVSGYYTRFLHRSADAGGRDGLVNLMQHGMRDEAIVALFVSSDEYVGGVPS